MNLPIPILSVLIGAVVLFFGRRLFWLCVAAIGFAAGMEVAPHLMHEPTAILQLSIAVVFGYVLEWVFYSFLYRRDHLQQVLLTYGLILVFEEVRSLAVGDDVHGVPVPAALASSIPLGSTMSYPVYNLVISGACLIVAALLFVLLRRTRLGMMIRAGASNREMVRSLGIEIDFLFRVVFALGVALAAFAGMINAPASSSLGKTLTISRGLSSAILGRWLA